MFRYLGLSLETSFAEDVIAPALFHVGAENVSLDTPSDTEQEYSLGFNRGVDFKVPSFYKGSGDFGYAFNTKTIGLLLRAALGEYVKDATTLANQYYGTNSTILPSLVARVGKDVFEHAFLGSVVDSLEFEVSDGLCIVTANVKFAKDKVLPIKIDESQLTLEDGTPFVFHQVNLFRNGVNISSKVKTVSISISNNLSEESGRRIGSRFPYRFEAGNRTIEIKVDLDFDDMSVLTAFWGGNADGPTNAGSQEEDLKIEFLHGATDKMEVIIPRAYITSTEQKINGIESITQSVSYKAMIGTIELDDATTKKSDILVKVFNGQ